MERELLRMPGTVRPARFAGVIIVVLVTLLLVLVGGPFRTVPAGHVGVKDFFGKVSNDPLMPGIRLVVPLTRVVKMSVQTQEMKEIPKVPSKGGPILKPETSVPFQLRPGKAAEIYRTVG